MIADPSLIDQAEALVRELATDLTAVLPGECLCCYLWRQLGDYPCDGTHRHAIRFRDTTAPRATALRERLSGMGACCCDCELFMNGYHPVKEFWTPAREEVRDGVTYSVEAEPPEVLPPCAVVRPMSAAADHLVPESAHASIRVPVPNLRVDVSGDATHERLLGAGRVP